ncbi:MAG: HTH-type transcriptional activator CmpR [Smithella sp. PtaU1.Bin162]|nr:MAG: HTH-type transcriptional activator CmpR [Smithella sp. PtaU1.Bin162]
MVIIDLFDREKLCYVISMTAELFKNITLQQMEAVVALIAEGSFSRAAEKMHLTQPALTKNIKNVENCLGLKIATRSSNGVALTAEGRVVYSYACKMIKLRQEAGEKIVQMQGNNGGDIYIGASTIPATYLLPSALSAFRQKEKNVRLHVRTADSDEVINMVLGGETEIGFIGKKPLNKKLVFEPVWSDRLLLAVCRNHPWRKKKEVTVDELVQEPFIIREKGSATREVAESYLKKHKAISFSGFNICSELGSSEAVKEAVIAGLGVSIISVHAVCRELRQGLLLEIPLSGCRMARDFYLIRLKKTDWKKYHRLFINFIRCHDRRKYCE